MFSLYLILLYVVLVSIKPTRKLALALTPWLIFACSYDGMRLFPNYEFKAVDVQGIYEAEKGIFGIVSGTQTLIPGEYFAIHHNTFGDIMAGIFYLCWVPVPMAFGLWLFFKGYRRWYIRFSLAFLFINIMGFCGYYIHPAAPPWYVMNYGFEPVFGTPGNVAGLAHFDNLVGIPVFQSIYGKNANVFAAVPSLHAAYMLITTVYAILSKRSRGLILLFAFICIGIWWTAVYSGHHYIIDVLLGIAVTAVGLPLLEGFIFRLNIVDKFLRRYEEAI